MDRSELFKLGERLRRNARGELLDYIDGTIGFLQKGVVQHSELSGAADKAGPPLKVQEPAAGACPVCEVRRKLKALQMKRYRAKRAKE